MFEKPTFTTLVSHTTPISRLMEVLVEKTGCRMGNIDAPWPVLNSRVLAPPESSVETKIRLCYSDQDLSPDQANSLAITSESRPATVRELLIFLWTYPEEQFKYPLVALGEPGDADGPIVAYGYMVGRDRLIFIGRPSESCKWEAGCRFLIVSNSPV